MMDKEKSNEKFNKPMSTSKFIETIEALAKMVLKMIDATKLYPVNNGVPKIKKQKISKKLKAVFNIASKLPGKEVHS